MRDFLLGVLAVGVLLALGLHYGGREIHVALPGREPLEVRHITNFAMIAFFVLYGIRSHWVAIGGAVVPAAWYLFLFIAFSMMDRV